MRRDGVGADEWIRDIDGRSVTLRGSQRSAEERDHRSSQASHEIIALRRALRDSFGRYALEFGMLLRRPDLGDVEEKSRVLTWPTSGRRNGSGQHLLLPNR